MNLNMSTTEIYKRYLFLCDEHKIENVIFLIDGKYYCCNGTNSISLKEKDLINEFYFLSEELYDSFDELERKYLLYKERTKKDKFLETWINSLGKIHLLVEDDKIIIMSEEDKIFIPNLKPNNLDLTEWLYDYHKCEVETFAKYSK